MVRKPKYSAKAQKVIGNEMHALKSKRSLSRKAKIGRAIGIARSKGLKVPKRRSK